MNRKINWAISIGVFLTIGAFLVNFRQQINEVTFEYGKNYNPIRENLGIPPIESNWVMIERDSSHSFWMNSERRLLTPEPTHFTKIIKLSGAAILSEEDWFHYEFTDTLAFRVICNFNYADSTTVFELITYNWGQFPPTISTEMTREQADSIFRDWKLNW